MAQHLRQHTDTWGSPPFLRLSESRGSRQLCPPRLVRMKHVKRTGKDFGTVVGTERKAQYFGGTHRRRVEVDLYTRGAREIDAEDDIALSRSSRPDRRR